nr:MAG TPA: hypothetical protein [Caudoviricetes sp.]
MSRRTSFENCLQNRKKHGRYGRERELSYQCGIFR